MFDNRPALKAIFSTANLNGVGALLMSTNEGTTFSNVCYLIGIPSGTYNKYHNLTSGPESRKNPVVNVLTHPAATAAAFVTAAGYNLYHAVSTACANPSRVNLLVAAGWACAIAGDNALRRLDSVNFREESNPLGGSIKSKLKKAFNAVVSNPTLFYGWTSTFLVQSGLADNAAKNNVPMFSGLNGALGAATLALVGAGTIYALSRTAQAVQDKIPVEKINDGKMNAMACASKIAYTVVAFGEGKYGMSAGHLLFALSSLKTIYETRSALNKNKEEPTAAVSKPAP